MQRPIHEMLQAVSGRLSLHMPAMQGKPLFEALDASLLETTELPVTDDLHRPSKAIAQAERLLSVSAGAQASFMLHGGSTAGVHAMLLYACKRGDTVILPRNVHLSALNLCAIAGINPVFTRIEALPGGFAVTSSQAYRHALEQNPQAKAVFAVSSDYYGLLTDIPAIAELAHERGLPLLCDEAHGAYFNWRGDICNAGARGADLFVQSAHKTLPAVNAAAWLHAMDGIDTVRLRSLLRMVQTSSPSFTAMQSMDDARAWMDQHGRQACDRLLAAMDTFGQKAAALGFVDSRKAYPADGLRLVLKAPQGGDFLQSRLQELEIDVEMNDGENIVCILNLLDGELRLQRLLDALTKIAAEPFQEPSATVPIPLFPAVQPHRLMPLAQAVFADTELVEPEKAAGRVSAAHVGLYPPGVAWLTAGEQVTDEIVDMIHATPASRLFGVEGGLRCVR